MTDRYRHLIENLNHSDRTMRLDSLGALAAEFSGEDACRPARSKDVNNHIHTFYSFSPYSPAKALWMAYRAGLCTAGIMDHDSVSGAEEFIRAGEILGMATTVGAECRADFSNTALCGRRINNPDQKSIAYIAIHGIPHTQIGEIGRFFAPYSAERNKRNQRMVERLNQLTAGAGISLDFGNDVCALSKCEEGGSVTERHILYALAGKIIEKFGKGRPVADFLRGELQINFRGTTEERLLDPANPYYDYDLLGVLKSNMSERFYLDAKEECPDIRDLIALCKETGAVASYAYLGDVGDSVTGDKKPQKFEDDYIEELFPTLKELGFHAVTYMPSRNTREQIRRLKALCENYELFQISGEDINSPRQQFVCEAMRDAEFSNLVDSTWALIGHERAATADREEGMFSDKSLRLWPQLKERMQVFKERGLRAEKGEERKC